MARVPRWYRSSPWIGLVGGLMVGFSHQFGLSVSGTWWFDLVGITSLFDLWPPLGYLALAVLGFVLGWVFRWIEREYVTADESGG